MVLAPGLAHACPDAGECEYVMLCISAERLDRLGFHRSGLARVAPRQDDADLFQAVVRLADLVEAIGAGLEREGALLALLERLEAVAATGGPGPDDAPPSEGRPLSDPVRRVARHLEEHAADEVRLDDLALLAGMSPCRLNRLFAREVGLPPHEYQSVLRVGAVKAAIAAGAGLAEASAAAGFFDQSHMTRCFGRVVGMTPGVWARGLGKR
jgi:AraC-like DNA-binding protein